MTTISQESKTKILTMRITLAMSIVLMGIKFTGYFLTHSVAILSDALESLINVTAGAFALYSISFAAMPKDADHPYGHGKIENLSAGFEGALIFLAGLSIIGQGIYGFFFPPELKKLDTGMMLSGFAGLCNYAIGFYLIRKGHQFKSLTMIADGKHLISDTISSIGLIIGIGIIYLTDIFWIDNLLAIVFGAVILYTGFKLLKESITNLLDKADMDKLNSIIRILNANRNPRWVDMHNLRILKYGAHLHIDAHLTLPWYENLEVSHREMEEVEKIVKENMDHEMEFFIHADPCTPSSCPVCSITECPQRKAAFIKKLDWTIENMLPDTKHRL